MAVAKIISECSELSDCLAGILSSEYDLQFVARFPTPGEVQARLLILGDDLLESMPESDLAVLIDQFEHLGVPVLLAWTDPHADHRARALQLGCSDYLAPPLIASVVNAKCKTHVSLSSLKRDYHQGTVAVSGMTDETVDLSEMLAVQDAAILCLATIARVRDHSTGNHILRTQHYVKALAEHLRKHPQYAQELDDETIELFYKTSALHDIGKVGIPDSILQKPGSLSEEEYAIMKTHTQLGYQAIHSAQQLLERETHHKAGRFLKIAQQVTLSHHERWDGQGYPQGLKGTEIPLVARLMAVADVYDAMISRRPYKSAMDHDYVTTAITKGRGSHFDPAVVDAFLDLQDMFKRISLRLEDFFPSSADLTLHSLADLIEENDAHH